MRHTEVDKVASDWIAGKTDVGLTQKGKEQATTLAESLSKHVSFDHIFSSPLSRCQHLAAELKKQTQKDYVVDERLAELDFGEWEGKRLNLLYEQNPNMDLFSPPGGESIEQLCDRVFSFWEEVILNLKAKHVLVVAHGGTNSALMMKLTNTPKEKFWDLIQSYGGVNEIEVSSHGKIDVKRLNDVTFL